MKELQIESTGLPVLRLVDAVAHDELMEAFRRFAQTNSGLYHAMRRFDMAEGDLRIRLSGRQLSITPKP